MCVNATVLELQGGGYVYASGVQATESICVSLRVESVSSQSAGYVR